MNSDVGFIADHTTVDIDLWVILAIIGLAALIVFMIIRHRQFVKKEKHLEDILEEKYENEARMEESGSDNTETQGSEAPFYK